MNAPDDNTFWGWVAGGFAALVTIVFKGQNHKIHKIERQAKEDHEAHDKEIGRQRQNIAAIFEKLEQHAHRSEDRHLELLNALHQGLDRKVDR